MASGKLTLDKDGNGKGRYSDLRAKYELAFEKISGGGGVGSDQPSHNVYAKLPGGELSHVGAAWLKQVNEGANRGQQFFSFYIDDPNMAAALNLSAFPARDDKGKPVPGEFDVVWRRERRPQAAQ